MEHKKTGFDCQIEQYKKREKSVKSLKHSEMSSSSSSSSSSATPASFRIELNPASFKSISSVLTFVSKVGKELIMEIEKSRLIFRALNDAKSVRIQKLYIFHLLINLLLKIVPNLSFHISHNHSYNHRNRRSPMWYLITLTMITLHSIPSK